MLAILTGFHYSLQNLVSQPAIDSELGVQPSLDSSFLVVVEFGTPSASPTPYRINYPHLKISDGGQRLRHKRDHGEPLQT